MRYRVRCTHRNTGDPYVVEFEATTLAQAMRLAELSGHDPLPPEPPQPPAIPNAPPAPAGTPDVFATASLVCGVLAACLVCLPFLGAPVAAAGVLLGARSRSTGSAIRTAGLTTSIVALVVDLLVLAFGIALQALGARGAVP